MISKIFNLRFSLRFLLPLLMLSACEADESEYCVEYACYFSYDMRVHNVSLLTQSLQPNITDQYCMVWQEQREGVRHIMMQLNDGKSNDDVPIVTEVEKMQRCALGSGNGLIIGRSGLYSGELFCFDLQCPNCLKEYAGRKLQWYEKDGKINGLKVKCPRCNRVYNLQNRGVSEDGGLKLLRYKATADGSYLRI